MQLHILLGINRLIDCVFLFLHLSNSLVYGEIVLKKYPCHWIAGIPANTECLHVMGREGWPCLILKLCSDFIKVINLNIKNIIKIK